MEKNFITIAVTLITVLGSTAAWDFYKKKLDMKKKEESEDKEEKNLYVNRGLGHLGYAGRVGIYPEITVFNIHSLVS